MDIHKKLDFVLKMTRHALDSVQHFDQGGTVLPGPSAPANNNQDLSSGVGGFIGDFLGTNSQYQAGLAPIQQGTNVDQLNNAYTGVQQGLGNVGNLVGTVQPGVAQGANSQNLLTNQLTAQTLGGGPNPAQAALNNNTGNNIKNAAAIAAGVRGAGTNAGLIASNAANTAANTQQQAVGQGALLQQQQQLNAQNQLQHLAESQVNQGTNAIQLQNQAQQNAQNILQGANTAANNALVSGQQNINTTNAQTAGNNASNNQSLLSGVGGAIGDIGGFIGGLFAEGGKVPQHITDMRDIYHPHLAPGGMVWQNSTPVSSNINGGTAYNSYAPMMSQHQSSGGADLPVSGVSSDSFTMPEIGSQFASVTPAPSLAEGGNVGSKLKDGGKVPGKPKVGHDDYRNDTVDAKLSPGEVVIPLDVMHDAGKLGKMARFVAANIERKKAGRKLS